MIKYAFFDVDKTIYKGFSANDFIEYSVKNNFCVPEMERRMNATVRALINKELNYHDASQKIMDILGEIVEGKSEEEVNEVVDSILSENKLNSWFEPLYTKLKEKGYQIYLVSGGASFVMKRLAQRIDEEIVALSTEYVVENGIYTKQITNILNGELKAVKVRNILGPKEGREGVFSIGFGDSSGDIDMLREVDQGYLYNPSPSLKEIAKEENFVIFDNETVLDLREIDYQETTNIS
jgi:HAD superfamily hydrolase (TIGR01490 family)